MRRKANNGAGLWNGASAWKSSDEFSIIIMNKKLWEKFQAVAAVTRAKNLFQIEDFYFCFNPSEEPSK